MFENKRETQIRIVLICITKKGNINGDIVLGVLGLEKIHFSNRYSLVRAIFSIASRFCTEQHIKCVVNVT